MAHNKWNIAHRERFMVRQGVILAHQEQYIPVYTSLKEVDVLSGKGTWHIKSGI